MVNNLSPLLVPLAVCFDVRTMLTTHPVAIPPLNERTDSMTTNNGQMVLFQFSQPGEAASRFLASRNMEKDGKTVGLSVTLAKRKDVAKTLGLSPKKDGAQLDKEMLKVSDDLKSTLAREFAGYASSSDFTGGRLSIRKNKEGLVTITASVKQVKRQSNGPTDEEVAKLLGFSPEEVKAMREEQAKKDAASVMTVDV